MLLQSLRERVGARLTGERESGFTLVELLVVMLILGLLAAIAIPSFFNQRDKAKDAEAKSAARTAQTAIETYATDHNGSYDGATASKLIALESTLNDVAGRLAVTESDTGYVVTVTSTNAGHTFSISRLADGTTSQTCTPNTTDGDDGCPGGGNWGG